MCALISKKPANRLLDSCHQSEGMVGTQPIADLELGYWIRANSLRPINPQVPLVNDINQQFLCPVTVLTPASSTSTHYLFLDRFTADLRKCYESWGAAGATALEANIPIGHFYDAPNPTFGNSTVPWHLMPTSIEFSQELRDAGWNGLFAKLDSFAQLEHGWNSYSAPPPSSTARRNARAFLEVLRAAETKPNRVSASAVGGVGMTFRLGERKAYVEFLNGGRVYLLFSDGVADSEIKEVPPGYLSFVRVVGDIRGYLNA